MLDTFDNFLLRDNLPGYFTASRFVINEFHTNVLMLHHNIMNTWICSGGHADGEGNLCQLPPPLNGLSSV